MVEKSKPWMAFHFIAKKGNRYVLRNRKETKKGEEISEDEIKMCHYGLHSSLSETDAKQYKPYGSVLTTVAVWGRVIVAEDKIVSTHRKIIKEI